MGFNDLPRWTKASVDLIKAQCLSNALGRTGSQIQFTLLWSELVTSLCLFSSSNLTTISLLAGNADLKINNKYIHRYYEL